MAAFIVKFQRGAAPVFKTERFATLQAAHAHAAHNQERLGADLVVITEEDDEGKEVRDHAMVNL